MPEHHDEQVARVERACEVMHDAYEAAAPKHGWTSQHRSRVPWSDVPESNKATMREAVAALLDHLEAPMPEHHDETVTPTVYREGNRIRATDGQGYSDRVTDDQIRGHMPHSCPRAATDDAFCRAVLAIRAYERESTDV